MGKRIVKIGVIILLSTLCLNLLSTIFVGILNLIQETDDFVEFLTTDFMMISTFQTIITTILIIISVTMIVFGISIKLFKTPLLNKTYSLSMGLSFSILSGLSILLSILSIFVFLPILYNVIYILIMLAFVLFIVDYIINFILNQKTKKSIITLVLTSIATVIICTGVVVTLVYVNINSNVLNTFIGNWDQLVENDVYTKLQLTFSIYSNKGYLLGPSCVGIEMFKLLFDSNNVYLVPKEVTDFIKINCSNIIILIIGVSCSLAAVLAGGDDVVSTPNKVKYVNIPKMYFKNTNEKLDKLNMYYNHLQNDAISQEDYDKYKELLLK